MSERKTSEKTFDYEGVMASISFLGFVVGAGIWGGIGAALLALGTWLLLVYAIHEISCAIREG